MVIILALVLRRTPSVVPRERVICSVQLIRTRVHRRAAGAGRILQRGVYRAFRAHAFPVGALYRAPAAMRMMQAFGTLFEGAARRWAFVFVSFSQHQPAHAPGAVHGLVGGRNAFPQVCGPVAFGEAAFGPVRAQARLTVGIGVASIRTVLSCFWAETRTTLLFYERASPIVLL